MLHVTHWPGQEGDHFLMTSMQLCVFVMLGQMAIINQLLDIFWSTTSSCLRILSSLAVIASTTAKYPAQPLVGDGAVVATCMVLTTSHVPLSAYLHHILGCGWTCPKRIAGDQFFFSKIPKAKQKSMSSC